MGKAQAGFALLITAYGVFLLKKSLELPMFVLEVPGPGFLPLLLAVAIIVVGGALTINGIRAWSLSSDEGVWPDMFGWRRLAVATIPLFAFLFFLKTLGFFLMCLLYLAVVAYGLGVRSWRVLLTLPLIATVVLHLVFSVWLKVPLPKGILRGIIY